VHSYLLIARRQWGRTAAGIVCHSLRLVVARYLAIDLEVLLTTCSCLSPRYVGRSSTLIRADWSVDDTLEELNHGLQPGNIHENLDGPGLFIEAKMLIQVVSLLDANAADLFQKGGPEILWKVLHMISRIGFSGNIKPPLEHKLFDCLRFEPECCT
jgi:hypothetical protein